MGERGWRSGESTRLPPMWPGFDSGNRCHTWVEFVADSRLCSEGVFLRVLRFFPPSSKTNKNYTKENAKEAQRNHEAYTVWAGACLSKQVPATQAMNPDTYRINFESPTESTDI